MRQNSTGQTTATHWLPSCPKTSQNFLPGWRSSPLSGPVNRYTHTHTHTHAHAHAHAHAHTRTDAQTHTHTRTHTHVFFHNIMFFPTAFIITKVPSETLWILSDKQPFWKKIKQTTFIIKTPVKLCMSPWTCDVQMAVERVTHGFLWVCRVFSLTSSQTKAWQEQKNKHKSTSKSVRNW